MFELHLICSVLVISFIAVDGVTVKPVRCPSNKIAPHRRDRPQNWDRPRTFGYIYNLFGDSGFPEGGGPGNLEEQPQPDDPDDCGEIEDYDENDLSSLYSQRREGNNNRYFFNWFNGGNNPQKPEELPVNPPPTSRPPYTRPPQNRPPANRPPATRPPNHTYSPSRPPSGGYFGNNQYNPPYQYYPSDSIKPVHESGTEPSVNYRPGVVGGQVGQVIGVPIRPIRPPPPPPPVNYRPFGEGQGGQELGAPIRPINYPQNPINQGTTNRPLRPTTFRPIVNTDPPTFPQSNLVTRRPRPRRLNSSSNTVLGSFVDLLF